jgi:hypothetical protein
VRDGIIVEVEAHIGGLRERIGVVGQRQQPGRLVAARVRADVAEKMLSAPTRRDDGATRSLGGRASARLTEVTAQRDRWEQRFDQLKLPPVNTGERRSWWASTCRLTADHVTPPPPRRARFEQLTEHQPVPVGDGTVPAALPGG